MCAIFKKNSIVFVVAARMEVVAASVSKTNSMYFTHEAMQSFLHPYTTCVHSVPKFSPNLMKCFDTP